uniref:RNA polymerase-associated protein CTR9-like protein n=1 Tax=Parascaris univalens TaxID=6257 RepID=A0A915AIZ7_PARUN
MSSYRPKTSVEIPLRDSTENGLRRRLSDLCIGVWNLTQRWEELNGTSARLLEKIINARLRLLYARQNSSHRTGGPISMVSIRDEDRLTLRKDEKIETIESEDIYHLNQEERHRIVEYLIVETENLTMLLEEEMARIAGKLQRALVQLRALRKLIDGSSDDIIDKEVKQRLRRAEEIIPDVLAMYRQELEAKRATLRDLASYDCRTIFVAIIASWNQQPFINNALLNSLYALVV